MTLKDAIQNPEWMLKYSKWLDENKEKLVEPIEYLDESDNVLNEEVLDYLKSKDWYKDNKTISKCLSEMCDRDSTLSEIISVSESLLKLYNTDKETYGDKIKESEEEINDCKNELNKRNKIRSWLSDKNSNEKIQDTVENNSLNRAMENLQYIYESEARDIERFCNNSKK